MPPTSLHATMPTGPIGPITTQPLPQRCKIQTDKIPVHGSRDERYPGRCCRRTSAANTLNRVSWEQVDPVGEGHEHRAKSNAGDLGSALCFEETLVHGSVLTGKEETDRPSADELVEHQRKMDKQAAERERIRQRKTEELQKGNALFGGCSRESSVTVGNVRTVVGMESRTRTFD